MPKYYCDYCDTYLTHDSPSVRKTHCQGRKHKDNVRYYYQKWMEDKAQQLIDETTAAYKAGKIATNPYAPGKGVAIPPPMVMPPGAIPGPPMPLPPGMPPQPMMAPPVIPPPNVNSMMVPPPMMRPGAPAPPMMGAVMQVPPMASVRPPLLSAPLPQVAK